jgi:hypothetical protein
MGNIPNGIKDLAPGIEEQAKALTDTAPKKGSDFDFNDFLIRMGLGMMAGKSPHALTNVGEAGLGALKSMDEQRKAASDRAYQESHMGLFGGQEAQARANADYLANEKAPSAQRIKALTLASTDFNKWLEANPGAEPAVAAAIKTRIQKGYLDAFNLDSSNIGASAITPTQQLYLNQYKPK